MNDKNSTPEKHPIDWKANGNTGWMSVRENVKTRFPKFWIAARECKRVVKEVKSEAKKKGFGKGVIKPTVNAIKNTDYFRKRKSNKIWLDLGEFGELVTFDHEGTFQDHGMGILRTILHQNNILTDLGSTRTVTNWNGVRKQLRGYDTLIMNVRSYNFNIAKESARIFKELNPNGMVITGGMHAQVAPDVMGETKEFDKICIGPGEEIIVDLISNPNNFARSFQGKGAPSMAKWPRIDRTLWPQPSTWRLKYRFNWPLEPGFDWGPRPVASVLTSRVCPWQCSFCNEHSYIPNMGRRPVDMVIDELNELDDKYGVGSVVIHDSMFFQNPSWLEEWLEKYPKNANKLWPYWAAGRADTVAEWPDLFEALVKQTNWNTVSIGFESGSDRVLRILNKQCTEVENNIAIDLLNKIGDDQESQGIAPAKFWSNIMFGIPGEKNEDAFKTIRMMKRMKRAQLAIAFYAPYPGGALGYQIIAEGGNLLRSNHERNPWDEKIRGVDYDFYRELFAGKYDAEIDADLEPEFHDNLMKLPGGENLAFLLMKA